MVQRAALAKSLLAEPCGKGSEVLKLRVDNRSAMKFIKNPEFHKQLKHTEVWYYLVDECTRLVV